MKLPGSFGPLRRPVVATGRITLAVSIVLTALVGVPLAAAFWNTAGSAYAVATTARLAAPTGVTSDSPAVVPVRVEWEAGTGGVVPEGYYVTRLGAVPAPACDSGPDALVHETTCLDHPGHGEVFRYVVTAVHKSWTASSQPSALVTAVGPLTVANTLLKDAVVDDFYSLQLAADGGTAPFRWAVSGLPEGLHANEDTGVISGTPGGPAGFADVSITVTDARDKTSTRTLTLAVRPAVSIATGHPPVVIADAPYATTLLGTGGTTPYSWAATGLPDGLVLDPATGEITGSATGASGDVEVSVTITDAHGKTSTKVITFTVERPTTVAAGGSHTCALLATGAISCWGYNYYGQLGDGTTTNSSTAVAVVGLAERAVALAVGNQHTCALLASGAATCWGQNNAGQLGDGTTTSRSRPVAVAGLGAGVSVISAGTSHSCAVVSGVAKCWGGNTNGQLGDASTLARTTPVAVVGLAGGVSAIEAGNIHTCAVVWGAARCWGNNGQGQLGDGTATQSTVPVQVSGLSAGVDDVIAGSNHTCALVSGAALCWGYNNNGQLGDGTIAVSRVPRQVTGLTEGVSTITAGNNHSCAVTYGAASCWGYNSNGQLGDGTLVQSLTPVPVLGLASGITALTAGTSHSCALGVGAIRCWGLNNYGQLGDGTVLQQAAPVAVGGPAFGVVTGSLADAMARSAYSVTLFAAGGNAPYTWAASGLPVGLAINPATGVISGTPAEAGAATVSITLTDAQGRVAGRVLHLRTTPALAITTSTLPVALIGHAYTTTLAGTGDVPPLTWAATGLPAGVSLDPATGELAGTPTVSGVHQVAATLTDAVGTTTTRVLTLTVNPELYVASTRLAALADVPYSGALVGAGGTTPYTWAATGLPDGLSLASATGVITGTAAVTGESPVQVTITDARGVVSTSTVTFEIERPAMIAVGDIHTCALSSGDVRCWGHNGYGQLGDGTLLQRNTPVQVQGLGEKATAIAVGASHSCALLASGGVKCWGFNSNGQLGNGTFVNSATPVQVAGLTSGVTAIGAGSIHTCAVKSGGAQCWGYNAGGQLGNGTTSQSATPVAVSGLAGVTTISAGNGHTCAVVSGAVRCWGSNGTGQLGDGSVDPSTTPVQVLGLTEGASAVSVGGSHSCAVVWGAAQCWGHNGQGQLGDGTTTLSTSPVTVSGLTADVTGLDAGGNHTCAVVSGALRCWGYNNYGQLGDGTTTARATPVAVTGLDGGVTSLAGGSGHTCVLTPGGAQCWGYNLRGQLGNGTIADTSVPVTVRGLTFGVATTALPDGMIGSPYTTTLLGGGGSAPYTWSANGLPLGLSLDSATGVISGTPAAVGIWSVSASLTDAQGRVAGTEFALRVTPALAITTASLTSGIVDEPYSAILEGAGDVGPFTWSASGLPAGLTLDAATGTIVGTPSAAGPHSVTVTLTDAVGTIVSRLLTVTVSPAVSITTSSLSALADAPYTSTLLATGGTAPYTWSATGLPEGLSLDAGTGVLSGTPTGSDAEATVTLTITDARGKTSARQVPFTIERPTMVATGTHHSCALLATGSLRCWGYNGYGQLGNGTTATSVTTPVQVWGLTSGVVSVATGQHYTCALLASGAVKCWGSNSSGQLGDGSTGLSTIPVQVTGLTSGATAITAPVNGSHTCAVVDGSARCWGNNASGQLGNGSSATTVTTPVQVSGLTTGVTTVSAGISHTCAVVSGAARCWGYNGTGQLGDGTTSARMTAVPVSGLTASVTTISAGGNHTCAVVDGAALCWGNNTNGQLGDGTITQNRTPVQVTGLSSGVTAITAGPSQTCAVVSGAAKCWGHNNYGQLGDGTTSQSTTAVQVSGLATGVTAIATGYYHTCALQAKAVRCWGYNSNGQLGDGTTVAKSVPVEVRSLAFGVATASLPDAMVGVAYNATVLPAGGSAPYVWSAVGLPDGLKINSGSGVISGTATAVGTSTVTVTLSDDRARSTARTFTLRVTPALSITTTNLPGGVVHEAYAATLAGTGDAGPFTWSATGLPAGLSLDAGSGQISGTPTAPASSVSITITDAVGTSVTKVLGLVVVPAVSITTTSLTALADAPYAGTLIGSGGTAPYRWSAIGLPAGLTLDADTGAITGTPSGAAGQSYLDVTVTDAHNRTGAAVVTFTLERPTMVTAGTNHSCALLASGSVRCWGVNNWGQLGNGTNTSRETPVAVTGLSSGVTAIAASRDHTCAVLSSGSMKCWGANGNGQLGDGTTGNRNTPVQVPGLAGVTAVSAGQNHTCAVVSGGALCWGYNGNGQLGNNSNTNSPNPVQVAGLTAGVTTVSAASSHTCAVVSGAARCWGSNTTGRLGNNSTTSSLVPVEVTGLNAGVTAISAALDHTCAVVSGAAQCWGSNTNGELGNNSTTQSKVPVQVTGLGSGVTAISTSNRHTCAVVSAVARCWGYNSNGQLGNDTVAPSSVPVPVAGLGDGVTAIAAGSLHSCALTAATTACWGYNASGQLGDGSTTQRNTPVAVRSTVFGITTGSLPDGMVRSAYPSTTMSAVAGTTPYTWAATGLPAGLTINASTGAIAGTPTTPGVATVRITLTDAQAATVTRTYTVTISPALAITTTILPSAVVNEAYSTPVAGTADEAPVTWSASGLPPGLTMSRAGRIWGAPLEVGTSTVTVTLTDALGNTKSKDLALIVEPAVRITTTSLPGAVVGQAYTATLTGEEGAIPYTWSATGLPAGLSLASGTGVISGTPTGSAGNATVTVTITDAEAFTRSKVFTLTVNPVLSITTVSLPNGTVNSSYLHALSATGGLGPYTWAATGLPGGLTLDPNTGKISGTPTATSAGTVSITVTDSTNKTDARGFTLTVGV